MINTVLCTAIAESFAEFSAAIEAGKKPAEVAAEALTKHWKVIFNGNGYSEEWPKEAAEKGVWRIDSGVDSIARLTAPKNVDLFKKMNVMSQKETEARAEVMFVQYSGIVEIEAKCMIDMINQHVLPSVKAAGLTDYISKLDAEVQRIDAMLTAMSSKGSEVEKAEEARKLRLETMEAARKVCDEVEGVVPPALWTIGTYKDLLFLDSNQGASA